MKIFVCDKCNSEFPQAIEEEKYKDEHGRWFVLDLCAPCKNGIKVKEVKLRKDELGKLVRK